MGEPLVPAPLIEDCMEVHLARHAPTGRGLYLTTLALTIAFAAAMPVVEFPITVQASGTIRPTIERQDARAAINGIVSRVYVGNGDRVRAGDTVVTLDGSIAVARLATSDSIAHERRRELADLATLLVAQGSAAVSSAHLASPYRRQQAQEYATVLAELTARAAAERRETERVRALLARGFVAPEQGERQAGAQRAAEAAVREHVERHRSTWSDAHAVIVEELRQLAASRVELVESITRHAIIAPVAGTIEMAMSLSRGSVLQQGEGVATISPNVGLIGEAWVSARDIALVRRGTPARLMIDALNYREWGIVEATVTDVADDASVRGDEPVFRVRCRLARHELRLRSGHRIPLGKGMTFRARFVIAERSLLQLLFDGVDDWINPARTSQTQASAP